MAWTGPTDQLTHRWPMDNANVSGTTISDVVGVLHGTAGSGVSSTAGPFTQARAFDGTVNGKITHASAPVNVNNALSIGFWTKITDNTAAGGGGANQSPIVFTGDAVSYLRIVQDEGAGAGHLALSIFNATNLFSRLNTTGAIFESGVWVHVCITHDGAGTFVLYKNGSSVTGGASGNFGPGDDDLYAFGLRQADGNGAYTGALSDVTIYTKVLSGAEVTQLYSATDAEPWPPPGSPAGPTLQQVRSGLRW